MKTVTFTELRSNASRLFDLVEGGETIRVLRHGKAIACVVPTRGDEHPRVWSQPGLRLVCPGAGLAQAVLEERQSQP